MEIGPFAEDILVGATSAQTAVHFWGGLISTTQRTYTQEIGGRGRSRACPWSVDEGVSLREAILYFVNEMGIGGLPDEQALLLEGS